MSLATSNRDGGRTSESGHLRAIQKVITGEVLTGLNVSQRSAGGTPQRRRRQPVIPTREVSGSSQPVTLAVVPASSSGRWIRTLEM